MNLLDKIVDVINDKLFDGVLNEHAFQDADIHGLSYLTTPKDGSPQRPYMIDGENVVDISISDMYPFSLYHRCTDVTFKEAPASAWGDGDGMVMAVFAMVAIIYGDRFKIGYTQEDVILKISSGLNLMLNNTDLNNKGLAKVRVNVSRVNNNSQQVFSGEYGASANCPLQMNSIYFGVQYSIEITANQKCLECQDC